MQPHSAHRQEEIGSGYLTDESIHDLLGHMGALGADSRR